MGLTAQSTGLNSMDTGITIAKNNPDERIIAIGGNPNVGKSTVFNALTNLSISVSGSRLPQINPGRYWETTFLTAVYCVFTLLESNVNPIAGDVLAVLFCSNSQSRDAGSDPSRQYIKK